MPRWILEPGHTAVEFCARHMMVTWVRGVLKDVHGFLDFDPAQPVGGRVEAEIDARQLFSGEPQRDAHLKSPDFLEVEKHPSIWFRGVAKELRGPTEFIVAGDLTVRGVTRPIVLPVTYLGSWETPYYVGDVDKGPVTRAGFHATTIINRHDFGVSWNSPLPDGGVVVGVEVLLTIDAEALLEKPGLDFSA